MKVLFVCSGNAYRSPVAEALLKKFRRDIEVESAGTNPSIPISESARKYLVKEKAEAHLKDKPERIDEKNLETYDLIVAMKNRHKDAILDICPECRDKIVVWNIEDPYFMPSGSSERIFNLIREKAKELADSL